MQLPVGELLVNNSLFYVMQRNSSLFKILSVILASGTFLVAVTVLGQISLPHLVRSAKNIGETRSLPSAEINYVPHQTVDSEKVQIVFALVLSPSFYKCLK